MKMGYTNSSYFKEGDFLFVNMIIFCLIKFAKSVIPCYTKQELFLFGLD